MSRPIKVTPAVVERMQGMRALKFTNKEIGVALGLSAVTVQKALNVRHANGFLRPVKTTAKPPKTEMSTPASPKAVRRSSAVLSDPATNAKKVGPGVHQHTKAYPAVPIDETEKEYTMLLQNQALDVETLDHFKLDRNPFIDDINTRADVFVSPSTRRVRAAMLNAATSHGFIAVVGESGSGKSTLRKELEERIRIEKLPIRIIKPFVVGVEPSDTKGKAMKTAAIADAIARTLAPGVTLKSSPDARMAQVQAMLTSSMAAGYNNLIVIEEAHRLPQATLRHLKGFLELEDGMRRMLGVCLIGQPELDDLLGAQNREIREIVQRCNRVALTDLDDDLEPYLHHKFERAGAKSATVLAANVYQAIATKLRYTPRGGSRMNDTRSVCYPLMVNNLVCKAMNFAAGEGFPQVTADVIAGC